MSLVKIFTVTKNETDLIEDFIVYHGKLIGYENIIVIDNCSTCKTVLGIYKKYQKHGVNVVNERSYTGGGQGKAFTKHMKLYKKTCTFLIGLDTDEFINMKRMDLFKTLSFLVPKKSTKFRVTRYMSSIPDILSSNYVNQKVQRPAIDITSFIREKASPPKYFFRSSAFVSTVNGCHDGKTCPGNITEDVDIEYIHFHSTGARRSMERCRSIISGYRYADVDSPLQVQLKSLISVTSKIGSHRVLEYALFLSKLLCLEQISRNNMWPKTPQCLESISETFPTIFGWKYSHLRMIVKKPVDWKDIFDSTLLHDNPLPSNFIRSTRIIDSIFEDPSIVKSTL